jgi:hypothetical protein
MQISYFYYIPDLTEELVVLMSRTQIYFPSRFSKKDV